MLLLLLQQTLYKYNYSLNISVWKFLFFLGFPKCTQIWIFYKKTIKINHNTFQRRSLLNNTLNENPLMKWWFIHTQPSTHSISLHTHMYTPIISHARLKLNVRLGFVHFGSKGKVSYPFIISIPESEVFNLFLICNLLFALPHRPGKPCHHQGIKEEWVGIVRRN